MLTPRDQRGIRMDIKITERFMRLFRGNDQSHGQYYPNKGLSDGAGRAETKLTEFAEDEIINHLTGKVGLGVVPIQTDGHCYFGAIDIDAHVDSLDEVSAHQRSKDFSFPTLVVPTDDPELFKLEVDLTEMSRRVVEHDLPLVVCRSKSGSAHLYCFASEALKAGSLRKAMLVWSDLLGVKGSEIYPKQGVLIVDDNGDRQLGNWINLPWFNYEDPDQLRYMIKGSQCVRDIERFLDDAENMRISATDLVERSSISHAGAPPCIQRMLSDGVGSGERNNALYNIAIYQKRAFPEHWKQKTYDVNAKTFDTAMGHDEASKIIASVGRKDYKYKCQEEPCKSRCNSAICVEREHGINKDDKSELEMGAPPTFGFLRRLDTEPVRWTISVDGLDITMTTGELMDYRRVRELLVEKHMRVVSPMKNERWQVMLSEIMREVVMIDAPEETRLSGQVYIKLREYAERAIKPENDVTSDDAEMLNKGHPVFMGIKAGDDIELLFKGTEFMEYLRKSRALPPNIREPQIWEMLKKVGGHTGRLSRLNVRARVWCMPLGFFESDESKAQPSDIKAEF